MSRSEELEGVLAGLVDRGLPTAELFHKLGRTRRFEIGPLGRLASASQEEGWAVRAGDDRGSFFAAGTGLPAADPAWPAPDGQPIELPAARPVPDWQPGIDLDASLAVEAEAFGLLGAIERALSRELPGARLLRAVLDEGTAEVLLLNSRQLRVRYRSRAALLRVEAAGTVDGLPGVTLLLAEPEIGRFRPAGVASALADRLLLKGGDASPERDRGEILLSPAVGAALLAALRPLLLGPAGAELAAALRDRGGRLGSPQLTLVDDGRLAAGVLAAPVDGEGYPTRETVLIREGTYCQPLLSWRDERRGAGRASGCVRRPGWRDLPAPGFSHLYLEPGTASAGSLVGGVARGYYLVAAVGAARVDLENDRFRLPVCGFVLRQGRARAPIARAWLCGGVGALLRGIQAVARDLAFHPIGGGMIGTPTLLVTGLELRGDPG